MVPSDQFPSATAVRPYLSDQQLAHTAPYLGEDAPSRMECGDLPRRPFLKSVPVRIWRCTAATGRLTVSTKIVFVVGRYFEAPAQLERQSAGPAIDAGGL